MSAMDPRYIIVRRERQTFRRLEQTGAIVFTVKTGIQSLVDLGEEERKGLAKEIRSCPILINFANDGQLIVHYSESRAPIRFHLLRGHSILELRYRDVEIFLAGQLEER